MDSSRCTPLSTMQNLRLFVMDTTPNMPSRSISTQLVIEASGERKLGAPPWKTNMDFISSSRFSSALVKPGFGVLMQQLIA
ncbi:hypothetical protein [Candidatus Amarolinea dominans]|uniref:hypothetical protein n=1 Tax=Candidatus Amarolinea dominans TaxID=3140696 RepID=UPI003134AEDF|nr:hypothetical protein [Anaerolineae bacterium]